jgi:hypothetical protein
LNIGGAQQLIDELLKKLDDNRRLIALDNVKSATLLDNKP